MNYFLPPAEVVETPEVKVEAPVEEMQSEAGAAGAVHGSLQAGAMASCSSCPLERA